jgi:hypothetical protein
MARKTLLTCDLHGDETPARSVTFALEGSSYEIDLCEEHTGALHDALAPYVGLARRSGSSRSRSTSRARSDGRRDASQTQAIRQWARSNGRKVSKRGRIPASVVEAYHAAQRR